MKGMRERATLVGGTLEIGPGPGSDGRAAPSGSAWPPPSDHDPSHHPDPARRRSRRRTARLRLVLDEEPDLEVVAEVGDGAAAVARGLEADIDLRSSISRCRG